MSFSIGVRPVEILPVFPDFDHWTYSFAQVQFDEEPVLANEEMNQPLIGGVLNEFGERSVAYFLPTEETIAKLKLDEKEGREYLDDCEYEYKIKHEYIWNKANESTGKRREADYFFVFRDDRIVYNELEISVRLTKRRTKIDTAKQSNLKMMVKHRGWADDEFRQHSIRLKSLQPPPQEEESERELEENLDTTESCDPVLDEISDNERGGLEELSDKESDKEERKSNRSQSTQSDIASEPIQLIVGPLTSEAQCKVYTPFIDLNSSFPYDAHASLPDAETPLADLCIPINKPTNAASLSGTYSSASNDCSTVANDSGKSDSLAGQPRRKRKRGRKCENTGEQSTNPSMESNLIDGKTDKNPITLNKSPNQDGQPPLIHYESADPGESSDSDRPFATKRVRTRSVSHSQDLADSFHFSDSEFEHFYSPENLYNDRNFFDNRRYRVFVQRYHNEIRVFKPVCVVRETGTLLLKVLGLYCQNPGKLQVDKPMPPGFIWPLNFRKHEDNVTTIRRLIRENPVEDLLPFVSIDEGAINVQPFSLDVGEKDESMLDRICQRTNSVQRDDEEPDENDENLNKKKPSSRRLISRNKPNSEVDAVNHCQPKISRSKAASYPAKAHCPYCHQRFSASFNAKMHFKGRFKHGGVHISCPVSSKLNSITLEPVICTGTNCVECLRRQSNQPSETS